MIESLVNNITGNYFQGFSRLLSAQLFLIWVNWLWMRLVAIDGSASIKTFKMDLFFYILLRVVKWKALMVLTWPIYQHLTAIETFQNSLFFIFQLLFFYVHCLRSWWNFTHWRFSFDIKFCLILKTFFINLFLNWMLSLLKFPNIGDFVSNMDFVKFDIVKSFLGGGVSSVFKIIILAFKTATIAMQSACMLRH